MKILEMKKLVEDFCEREKIVDGYVITDASNCIHCDEHTKLDIGEALFHYKQNHARLISKNLKHKRFII